MSRSPAWKPHLATIGYVAMLVGALDPLEGSLAILPGSALVMAGAWLTDAPRPVRVFRAWMFALVAFGVAALWGFTAIGGIGGAKGPSMAWGLLVVPYLAALSASLWGPGSPRWAAALGLPVGVWYLALPAIVLLNPSRVGAHVDPAPLVLLGVVGLVTLVGCGVRLFRR